ncbi:hypothetical protein C8D87_103792 [Lentzea atacamensis]|uniref:Terpene synthase n=1 Tax=Lentzea atacamensis TaxID=531938 RepID=A0ABX9EEW8_9PSEU|nr:hypothetical protein [Lentzea atacamensis]RAS67453.1 hypothetical protein C8D87_103792 [Lentzea atacamensis]
MKPTTTASFAHFTGLPVTDAVRVFCPVPLKTHPIGAAALDRHACGWAIQHGLITAESPYARMNLGLVAATSTPFSSPEFAKAWACAWYWAVLWDDWLDGLDTEPTEQTVHTAEVLRVLSTPSTVPDPEDRWIASFRDLSRLMKNCLPSDGLAGFQRSFTNWLIGDLWKRSLQRRTAPPSLGEYLRMRWQKAALESAAWGVASGGAGYTLTVEEHLDPVVHAFTQAVLYPCALFNDLVSLAKEAPAAQAELNILTVLAREHGIGRAEALGTYWELHERTVSLMLRLQRRLLADPRPHVVRYAVQLPQWLPATIHWTSTSLRYLELPAVAGNEGTSITLPSVSMVADPTVWDPDDLTPPPYPDIAWWWDQVG